MCVNLRGHREWAKRPADQRFRTVQALIDSVRARRADSKAYEVNIQDLVVETDKENLTIRSRHKQAPANFTHWSFDQFSKLIGAPAYYLNKLPAELAAINLNHGIEVAKERPVSAFVASHGNHHTLRATLTPRYSRIWDDDLISWIYELTEGTGWQLPQGFKDGKWGAELVPSGAYGSDRDVFLFMVDYSRPIEVLNEKLFRGFYIWNSEVGSKTVGLELFLFRLVCGNNMVHGYQNVGQLKRRHIGELLEQKARNEIRGVLDTYMNSDTHEETRGITRAMNYMVEKPNEFLREKGFAKHETENAIVRAKAEEGDTRTAWQLLQGLTSYARTMPNMDDRTDLEKRSGKLLALAA